VDFETQNGRSERLCDICGERPGVVAVMFAGGGGRRSGLLCERCARQMVAQQQGGLPGGIGDPGDLDGRRGFGGFGGGAMADTQRRGTGAALRQRSPERTGSQTPVLDEYGHDLTAEARGGGIDPVIGRASEIEQVIEVLARRRKNNAVLIGEAGVGKTAIAEGLALRIAHNDVPDVLRDVRVVALDLSGMVAGTQYRGAFEQRLKGALEEVVAAQGTIILFVDELHNVLGAGAAEGAMDAANILKPMLARGTLRMVGATTLAEYRKIERDAALARRFSAVMVEEPSVTDTVEILRGLRSQYEEHHRVEITDEALEAAARLSDRYISEYRLPDKAIDLVDQASARLRLAHSAEDSSARLRVELDRLRAEKQAAVDAEAYEEAGELKARIDALEQRLTDEPADGTRRPASAGPAGDAATPSIVGETEIAAVVATRTGIPVGELVAAELARLGSLEQDLHRRVIGQQEAVRAVAETVRHARAGLAEPDRPLGSFLFLGPTGVGKTELVKTLAERLFATEKALVRIDMSEYREPHTVARLIGSPPGYVGYGDGGQLTEPVRRRPYSVVLLDEIEKAHPEVWNVLLQVLDDGRLTDGEGRTVDFTNTVVVMTSNLGAGQAKRSVGFTAGETGRAGADSERMLAAAKHAFLPEFLNRIDELVVFEPLSAPQVRDIAQLMCARIADRLREERGIELEVTTELVAQLASDGFDAEFGARPLKRHIRRTLEKELTRAILDGTLSAGAVVRAVPGDDAAVVLEVAAAV
jgi:ATP-dependent Clp protease ATP-binding subunit ClpC